MTLDICGCGAWKYSVSKGTEGLPSVAASVGSTCQSMTAVADFGPSLSLIHQQLQKKRLTVDRL